MLKRVTTIIFASAVQLAAAAHGAELTPPVAPRQDLSDAWWTGPLLTSGAETLPAGHLYFEPYLFDVLTPNSSTIGSRSYLLYGAAPRLTVGVLPAFFAPETTLGGRKIFAGDLTLSLQYRLTKASPDKSSPTISLLLQPHFPTSKFDKLGPRQSAVGTGNVGTLVGLSSQQYFWLPNGRILRARLNVSRTFEGRARIHNRSVYGTDEAFDGWARPASETRVDLGLEYSLSKRLVLATDVSQSRFGKTRIDAFGGGKARVASGYRSLAIAPAIEYSWSSSQGVIAGVRWIPRHDDRPRSVTPAIAYSLFL